MIEIQFKYRSWISIKISHRYFKNHLNESFIFTPHPRSERLMRQAGLEFRNFEGGMVILMDQNRLQALKDVISTTPDFKLSFWLYLSDGYFFSYTNLPIHTSQITTILYFNAQNNPQSRTLHPGEFIDEKDLQLIRPSYFELPAQSKERTVSILDLFGQEKGRFSSLPDQKLSLNLQGWEEGKYAIYEGDQCLESFILLDPPNLRRPLALFDLPLDQLMKKEIIEHIQSDDYPPPLNYEVKMNTRYTYWRYFIIPKYEGNKNKMTIDTGDKSIKFKGPEEATIPNGSKALMFESNQALALQEVSPYRFQLIKKKDAKGKDVNKILKRLPSPSLGLIKPNEQGQEEKVYSDIFVYI